MRGRYKFKLPKAGNGNVLRSIFFLHVGEICKRRQRKLLLYSTTNREAQTPTYVEVLPSFAHCRWMNTNTARQEHASPARIR